MSDENSPKKIKPASIDKQKQRQEEVKQLQHVTKEIIILSGKAPKDKPIDDKFVFGLKKNPNTTQNAYKLQTTSFTTYDKLEDKYKPVESSKFFEKQTNVKTKNGTFTCYINGVNNKDLIFVCLHGAGHSGLSYALLSKLIYVNNKNDKDKYQIFTFDYRGHGNSVINDEYNMSKDNLVNDIIDVLSIYYSKNNGYNIIPPIILVGHSLGGALAVHVAQMKNQINYYKSLIKNSNNDNNNNDKIEEKENDDNSNDDNDIINNKINILNSVAGICVIDVVEGTALNSLIYMRGIINKRKKIFLTIEEAIEYCVRNGIIKNINSAKISVSAMMKYNKNKKYYEWRTDVLKTEKYWRGWFIGLSDLFLGSKVSKMLMIADTNRLDKKLTIGQMQGKYQMCVMGLGVGHTIHEDSPDRVCIKLIEFVQRNQFIKMFKLNQKLNKKK